MAKSAKKPRYTEELLKIIFLWLSISFIITGLLCFIGLLTPSADSLIQESSILGIVFSLLGIAFFVVQVILKSIASSKNRLHRELLAKGTEINGTVEKVYLQKYTQYGRQSPYRILYTYTWQDKIYHHKSCLLWNKPDFMAHDPIMVYANASGQSTIPL